MGLGPRGPQGLLGQAQLGGSRAVAGGGTSTFSHRGAGPNENTMKSGEEIKKAESLWRILTKMIKNT